MNRRGKVVYRAIGVLDQSLAELIGGQKQIKGPAALPARNSARGSTVAPSDLPIWTGTGILTAVRVIRRHIVVRIVTCLLLTWAAVDLLVPELCSSEAAAQDHGSAPTSQDQDDCFCCCSHTEKALTVAVAFTDGIPVVVERFPTESLAVGIPRRLYHPPLAS